MARRDRDWRLVGWISMTDLFCLTTVMFVGLLSGRGKSIKELEGENKRLTLKQSQVLAAESRALDAKSKVEAAEQDAANARGAQAAAEERATELAKSLADSETKARDAAARADLAESTIRDSAKGAADAAMKAQDQLGQLQRTQKERDELKRLLAESQKEAALLESRAQIARAELEAEKKRAAGFAKELRKSQESERDAWARANGADLALKQSNDRVGEAEKKADEAVARAERAKGTGRGELSQRLLGLSGSRERVVFVVDRSESMEIGGRWAAVRKTIEDWVDTLDISHAAMLFFSNSVEALPETRRIVPMSAWKSTFLKRVKSVEPSGGTNTVAAFEQALELRDEDGNPPTSIIFFTDGRPTEGGAAIANKKADDYIAEVMNVVRKSRKSVGNIPVNVVGLGDYFDRDFGKFLVDLAKDTGGTFIGR